MLEESLITPSDFLKKRSEQSDIERQSVMVDFVKCLERHASSTRDETKCYFDKYGTQKNIIDVTHYYLMPALKAQGYKAEIQQQGNGSYLYSVELAGYPDNLKVRFKFNQSSNPLT